MAKKNKGGRPTVITPEVTAKLIEAFKNDFTQREACIYAGISEDSYQRKYASNESFAAEMDSAKAFLFFIAKRNIAQVMAKEGDIESTWKFLSKRQKEIYSEKVETSSIVRNVNTEVPLDDLNDDDDILNLVKKKK